MQSAGFAPDDSVVTVVGVEAPHSVVFVDEIPRNPSGKVLKNVLAGDAQTNFEHAARQAYIGFAMSVAQAAFEGVDATPMEGFDAAKLDEILGLREKGLRSVTILPIGYRAAEGDWLLGAKKVRKPMSELVTEIA